MKKYTPKTTFGKTLKYNKQYRIVSFAICGFSMNLVYAFYHGILGILSHSVWFLSLCAYYTVLSSMRFGVIMQDRRNVSTEVFITKFCGILLVVLAFVLSASTYLSLITNTAAKHREIVMITIATYTFYKVILAIVNMVKSRKENSLLYSTLRNIACADAAASMLSLQRSMLVSFAGKSASEIYIMNAITGAAVFVLIVFLGLGMILRSRKEQKNG